MTDTDPSPAEIISEVRGIGWALLALMVFSGASLVLLSFTLRDISTAMDVAAACK